MQVSQSTFFHNISKLFNNIFLGVCGYEWKCITGKMKGNVKHENSA